VTGRFGARERVSALHLNGLILGLILGLPSGLVMGRMAGLQDGCCALLSEADSIAAS